MGGKGGRWREDGKHGCFPFIALVGGTANNPINIRCGTSEFRGDEITEIKTEVGVEKGRIKLFLRHPSLSPLVLISCKIEIYGGESWGRNREGVASSYGKLKMYVVLSFFFFFIRAIYPFIVEDYRGSGRG